MDTLQKGAIQNYLLQITLQQSSQLIGKEHKHDSEENNFHVSL